MRIVHKRTLINRQAVRRYNESRPAKLAQPVNSGYLFDLLELREHNVPKAFAMRVHPDGKNGYVRVSYVCWGDNGPYMVYALVELTF